MSVGLAGCPGKDSHDDATAMLGFVRDNFPFPRANDPKIGPTIYFSPGVRATHLTVYGIRRTEDQDRIIQLARDARVSGPRKPVEITFNEAERFVDAKEGERGSRRRAGEKVLRKIKVDD
jgi:hypothetical protein